MSDEKFIFRPGMRVWFEGKKYTLKEIGGLNYTLGLEHVSSEVCFTEFGQLIMNSPKPSLKPVKKKKRQEVWVVFDEAHVFVNAFEKKITAEHYARINRGHIVRFVKAKEKRQE